MPYQSRLETLNLPSMQHRRRRGDMIETYKIMTGKVNMNKNNIFKFQPTNTRGHPYKIFKQHAKSFIRRHTFSVRVVNDWNALPTHIVKAQDTNQFKNMIDKHWYHHKFETPFD